METINENINKNQSENEWGPINFQWIPLVKLNQELNLKTRKMKTLLILPILIVVALTSSCSKNDDTIFGSGNLTTETRTVDLFTKISSESVFEVTVTQGTPQSVEIIADNNVVNYVKTRVSGNELRLYLEKDYNYRDVILKANIVVENLNGLQNLGAGNLYVHNLDNNAAFSMDNEGSGDIQINGISNSLSIHNIGSGDILGFDFLVNDCTIDIEGSGDVKISCSDNLDVEIEGSGNVYYKGNPSIITSISGSGKVIDAN